MADLTRFDFNAKKFLFSENVRQMDAAEIGSYILLLAESWMSGKDASLPDNPKYLANLSKSGDAVTPLVMSMFKLVDTEWGPRWRNETLYDEWCSALKRSEDAKYKVNVGRYGKAESPTEVPTTVSTAVELQKENSVSEPVQWFTNSPTQTKPNQSIPIQNQTVPNQSKGVERLSRAQIEKLGFEDELPAKETWKRCASPFLKQKKVNIKLGPRDISHFENYVSQYGSAHVLAAFDLWLKGLGNFVPTAGGFMFLKNIPQLLEAVSMMVEPSENEIETETYTQLEARMKNKLADEAIQDEIDRKKREADEKFELENRDQI